MNSGDLRSDSIREKDDVGEKPTNWRQLKLSNLLLSVALFGMAMGLAKASYQLSAAPALSVASMAAAISSIALFGGTVGILFSRFWRGVVIALTTFGFLAIAVVLQVIFFGIQ